MAEMELEILNGAVSAVVFHNYENGYAVLRLHCQDGQTVTVVGTIPMPTVGERLMVTGKWITHPSYGKQFEAEFLERLLPETKDEILSFLSSRTIKGIGPKIAARIVSRFGENTLKVLDREPQRLAEVPGISVAKAAAIGEAFKTQVGMRHLLEFFTLHHLPAELAIKAYKHYGDSTIDMLYDDPYLLMDDGLDAPFGAVDRFAIELGVDGTDPKRVRAGILFELRYNLNAGHSFLPKDKLTVATSQLLGVDNDGVSSALDDLEVAQRLVFDRLKDIEIVYLPELYQAECYCAMRMMEATKLRFKTPEKLDKLLSDIAGTSAVRYSPQQEDALRAAATSSLLLITGGPGTGKTTILKGILSLYHHLKLRCVLAAPTGRAAKRLTEVTGQEASTIHRLLDATVDPFTGNLYFAYNESNPLKADAIVIDEMSMVDIQLLFSLMLAVPKNCRLIFVGDPDQLPPVGPGFPFGDMLRSGTLPAVRLTEIFRQAQESLIVMNAHRVNQGQMPELKNTKSDFFFLPVRSEDAVAETICGLCTQRLPKNMGIPSEQIQVLSPTKRGIAGTVNLNKLLQTNLNPPAPTKKERLFGDILFRVADKVMQIRNNYDIVWTSLDGSAIGSGVYNGDIGTITEIDHDLEQITVEFDDKRVDYDFTQLNELEPAYAMTVHKSQGSEYRAVVLALWSNSGPLQNRSILYTAITRAKELLVIVGQEDTIAAMTQNAKISRRYSGLKLRLQGKEAEE